MGCHILPMHMAAGALKQGANILYSRSIHGGMVALRPTGPGSFVMPAPAGGHSSFVIRHWASPQSASICDALMTFAHSA